MTKWTTYLLTITFLLCWQTNKAQADTVANSKKYKKSYTNEFFVSGGYSYSKFNFLDAGVRYYHWKNDGQTIMAFAGPALGCEFSVAEKEQIYIPYIGWQGQLILLAYGLRAEYVIQKEKQVLAFTPEVGFSLFEVLRITGGYRFRLDKSDPMRINDFRVSVIAAFPLSFLKPDAPE
ncbi:MAG: hypothetical protein V4580_04065 [Bacteroidota bacterium]